MKNSAFYVKQVKRFFTRLKRSGPKPTTYDSDDPVQHLVVAALSEGTSLTKAKTAANRLLAYTIDYNDLRVSTPDELAKMIEEDLPDALARTTVLVKILGSVYERENSVSLDRIKSRGKKEIRAYLQELPGMTPYILASTMLWAFGEHAIPVDEQTLTVLKKDELVDAETSTEEAQAFLKRHISANDAKLFSAMLKRYVVQKAPRNVAPESNQAVKK